MFINERRILDCMRIKQTTNSLVKSDFLPKYWPNIRNMSHFITLVREMDEKNFKYHVNEKSNKNDFADWIRNDLGNNDLAFKLEGIINRNKYLEVLMNNVNAVGSLILF